MAQPTTQVVTTTDAPDALTADRERFWNSFTRVMTIAPIVIAVLLVLMALFLT